ncbi:MAG: restriction endonuclease subunit S [Moraxella sp.]
MNKQQEPRLRFKGFTGEWKNKTLGDLGRVEMCRRIFKEQTQPSGEIPFFKIGTFGQEPDAFISSELFEKYRQKYPYPKQGDILISAAGTIGRTVEFTGENAYFQDSNIVWLRFDESQITSTFLNITYQNIKWGLEGSTIKRLYNSDLLSTEITLPSFPEQTHLGLFFRRLDSQIAESRAVLEKSRQLKKAMLAKMFPANGEKIPKIRFKGFEGEWECRKFSEVAELRRGLTYSPLDISQNGIRVLRSSNIDEEYYIEKNDDVFVCERAVNIPLAQNGDILITAANGSSRLVGKHAIIQTSIPAVHGGFMLLARTENPYFLNASMSSAWYLDFIRIFVAGGNGAIGNLSIGDLNEQEILIPKHPEEQTAIGNFFRQLDETIALQSAEVEKLNRLKKGLLAAMLV